MIANTANIANNRHEPPSSILQQIYPGIASSAMKKSNSYIKK